MAIIMQIAISAQNTFSDKFFLAGDGTTFSGRRCLVCATAADSKVTIRRYGADKAATTPLASLEVGSVMATIETPVEGWYDIGVKTGDYGAGPVTITAEQ